MAELTVVLRTHHFVVKHIAPAYKETVERFARQYVQFGLVRERGKYFRAALRVFAAATQDRTEYRFHINTLKLFKEHLELNLLKGELVKWEEEKIPSAKKVELPVFSTWVSHDYQLPVIEYLKDPGPPRCKFVNLQTGKGKSYCSLRAISDLGERAVIIVRPMYLDKWLIDIRKTYDITIEELMVIRGSDQLMALLAMAESADLDDVKLILISNKTLQNWLKLYEKFGDQTLDLGYACTPDQLFTILQAGYRLIDEVHQDFHLNFKIDLYTHVDKSASLSATLVADDDFLNKMYEVAYPSFYRYKGEAYDKYIAARAVIYRLKNPNKIQTQEYGSKTYSHHAMEKSIVRQGELLGNYLELINQVINGSRYGKDYKPGDKLLVYCSSIDLLRIVTAFLKRQHPTKDVRRYVEDDPYENLMEPDIRVTTLLSAGTGVDIPKLVVTVLTVAVASSQSNIQGFGRLRKLPDGTTPEFYYFVCEDVAKHLTYHERKRELLRERALTYKAENINQPL